MYSYVHIPDWFIEYEMGDCIGGCRATIEGIVLFSMWHAVTSIFWIKVKACMQPEPELKHECSMG